MLKMGRYLASTGTSFTGSKFWDYYQESCFDVYYASIAHPRCKWLKARIYDPVEKYGSKWL